LEYEIRRPRVEAEREQLIVLMHGRGATRFDLLPLADRFPDSATLLFPEAPFDAAPWGYGAGSAWYRFMGRNRPEPESFARSLDVLAELLNEFNSEEVVVGGFSQGGTMAIAHALERPHTRAINFSGFLADHPRVDLANAKGKSIFWGHGKQDYNIPFELAIEGRALLRDAGANVSEHDYAIGHWIDAQELNDAVAWLEGVS
jgi:phospholipase/carboxylesterase